MGVNIKDPNEEGAAFAAALAFHSKDKDILAQLKPLPKSSEWEEYLNSSIIPDGNAPKQRPSKDEYYLNIAEIVASRGTCIRRRFGAIIVKDDTIISTGYVGAPRSRKNCCDLGKCFRMENNIPSGQRYELCRSVHAEMNAIINADPIKRQGGTMYLVGKENNGTYTEADCCSMCKRTIINSGISKVVFRRADKTIRSINVEDWITDDDSLRIHEGY